MAARESIVCSRLTVTTRTRRRVCGGMHFVGVGWKFLLERFHPLNCNAGSGGCARY